MNDHSQQRPFTEDDIRRRARQIWRERGGRSGHTPEEDWQEAEQQLLLEASSEQYIPVMPVQLRQLRQNLFLKALSEPLTWIIPVLTLLVTLYTQGEADHRQRQRSQDLNHQSISESFIQSIGQVRYSTDYQYLKNANPNRVENGDQKQPSEVDLLRNRALIAFREMEFDGRRKANIVLFLYQLGILNDYEILLPRNASVEPEHFFKGGDLKFGDFRGYTLERINLIRADLRGADFSAAQLTRANLSNTNLSCHRMPERWHWFSWAFLREALFMPEILLNFDTYNSRKRCANLRRAKLIETNLRGANLKEADLRGASLAGSNLSQSQLQKADLESANLSGADFDGANLAGADFKNAVLLLANLRETVWDEGSSENPRNMNVLDNSSLCLSIVPNEAQNAISRDCEFLQQQWHRRYYPDLYISDPNTLRQFERRGWANDAEATIVNWSELDEKSQFCAAIQRQFPAQFNAYFEEYQVAFSELPLYLVGSAADPAYCDRYMSITTP